MNIRARLERLEHPIFNNPCFRLAERLRLAKACPVEYRDPVEVIAKLELAGDKLSLRIARALQRVEVKQ